MWHNGAMNEKQTDGFVPKQPTTTQTADKTTLRPTKRQKELLSYIEQFIGQHGYSPSYREIMNGLEYNSVATVALHVGNLIARGHLHKRDHSARSLEVVNPTTETVVTLPTNQIKPAEEKWLVDKLEQLLTEAESAPQFAADQLENLYIVAAALRVLGAEGAAQSFAARLATLKHKQTKA